MSDEDDGGEHSLAREAVLSRLSELLVDDGADRQGAVVVVAIDEYDALVAEDPDGTERLMAEVLRRLDRLIRSKDILVRFDEDRFVVVGAGLTPEVTGSILERIAGSVAMPLDFGASLVSLGATVGVAFLDDRVLGDDRANAMLTAAERDVERIRSRRR